MLKIDHFVVGAADLETGTAWMHAMLGAPPVGHGKHVAMSTHNALWRVGTAYLEVIAVDPDAPDPGRPRWFGLDDRATQARIATQPRLLTWVASTTDLAGDLKRCSHNPGPVLTLSRDDLVWKLTVPDDGHVPGGGAIPHLIEWPEPARSPSQSLPDQRVEMVEFTASCTSQVATEIEQMGAGHLVGITRGNSSLSLALRRPDGAMAHIES